ncbi:MAG: sodium/solute symporter [Candidatus Thermoplasmatota archaeon]|nr:sodium/solute symporter [Candidatus Thermoplasmatota archaeon]
MDIILFIIFMGIFAAVFTYLGYLGYKKTKTKEDYYVAGRKMGPVIIAFSYGATFISAVALIGFSGMASIYGFSLLWLAFLNIFVGIIIAFIFYGFRTRKMGLSLNAMTLPELLGNRFNSKKLQATSGLIIAIFIIFYTTAVFLAIASLFEITFGIPYWVCVVIFTLVVGIYLIVGGLYAVMWTHAIQGVLMLIGMLILGIRIYGMLGGIGPAHEAAASITTQQLLDMGWKSVPVGFTTLTSMPEPFSPAFMFLLTLIFGVGIGVLAQPQLIIRYLSAKDEKSLRQAIPYGGIFILLMTFIAFSIGPLCNVLMINNGLQYPGTPDKVVPLIVNEFFPTWFVILFLFAILSAAMSTASALFHTAGASIGRDVCEKGFMKECSEKKALTITRVATFGIVIATLLLSIYPPDVVAVLTSFFFGLMACTFLAPYTLMLYWKKTSRAGAWAGILGGFIFTMIWYIFVYYKTAPSLIGGSITNNYIINMLDPIFIGLPLSFILTFVFSITIKQDKAEIETMNKAFESI